MTAPPDHVGKGRKTQLVGRGDETAQKYVCSKKNDLFGAA